MLAQHYKDSDLLAQWRKGDRKAFNSLFERYFNKLLQFTHKRIGDKQLAEELVMDVLLRLWQHRDDLAPQFSLGPYLFKSIKNAIIDDLRKKTRETLFLEALPEEQLASISLEDNLIGNQLTNKYLQSLNQLSPQRKKAFELSRHEGKSYKEIAVEMNVSISTVKQHISSSLSTMRELMKEYTNISILLLWLISLLK